ncbi:MAG: alpha/beta hydrolase [Alphaproteobacteria bacterium]|nr:alpha/beta hydrolase [Alphaproteobacteria bacterium]
MIRILLSFAVATMLGLPAFAKPYTIPSTEVIALRSKQTGANYQLFVSLPSDYRTSKQSYPVVYMLDADYSFALVRNIVQHFVEREDLPPVILVAVAYPGAASDRAVYRMNRTRDYTPAYAPDGGYGAEYQKVSGGGPKFRAFIATELIPLIERRYRAARDDRTIIGHSYGGLFATYVLLTQPALFKRYIIVSPSLWYSNRIALTMEEAAAASGVKPIARVFFAVGSFENQPGVNRSMVDDLAELVEKLKSHNNRNLVVRHRVFEGETHNSVFPAAVTRGLLSVFEDAN